MAQVKFLKALAAPAPRKSLEKGAKGYGQMLGIWLIDLALLFEWYRPKRSGRWRGIFTDEYFCRPQPAGEGQLGGPHRQLQKRTVGDWKATR